MLGNVQGMTKRCSRGRRTDSDSRSQAVHVHVAPRAVVEVASKTSAEPQYPPASLRSPSQRTGRQAAAEGHRERWAILDGKRRCDIGPSTAADGCMPTAPANGSRARGIRAPQRRMKSAAAQVARDRRSRRERRRSPSCAPECHVFAGSDAAERTARPRISYCASAFASPRSSGSRSSFIGRNATPRSHASYS